VIHLQDRISSGYLHQQKALHAMPRGYGARGSHWASTVIAVCEQYGAGSLLDYGCGQGSLAAAVTLKTSTLDCREYDPAIPGKDRPPVFADVVSCTDVLEHIEPEFLDNVLTHIRQLARRAVFLVVSTRPANKELSDGRNAHLIIQPGEWWQARVEAVGFVVKPPPSMVPAKKPGKAWVAVLEP
jgi:hypothetical protein